MLGGKPGRKAEFIDVRSPRVVPRNLPLARQPGQNLFGLLRTRDSVRDRLQVEHEKAVIHFPVRRADSVRLVVVAREETPLFVIPKERPHLRAAGFEFRFQGLYRLCVGNDGLHVLAENAHGGGLDAHGRRHFLEVRHRLERAVIGDIGVKVYLREGNRVPKAVADPHARRRDARAEMTDKLLRAHDTLFFAVKHRQIELHRPARVREHLFEKFLVLCVGEIIFRRDDVLAVVVGQAVVKVAANKVVQNFALEGLARLCLQGQAKAGNFRSAVGPPPIGVQVHRNKGRLETSFGLRKGRKTGRILRKIHLRPLALFVGLKGDNHILDILKTRFALQFPREEQKRRKEGVSAEFGRENFESFRLALRLGEEIVLDAFVRRERAPVRVRLRKGGNFGVRSCGPTLDTLREFIPEGREIVVVIVRERPALSPIRGGAPRGSLDISLSVLRRHVVEGQPAFHPLVGRVVRAEICRVRVPEAPDHGFPLLPYGLCAAHREGMYPAVIVPHVPLEVLV